MTPVDEPEEWLPELGALGHLAAVLFGALLAVTPIHRAIRAWLP